MPPPPPRHIAIIMDGNGRWAEQRGQPRVEGHRAGAKAVNRIVRACREMGVEALTLYAFSAQNWGRPEYEVAALMGLLHDYVNSERMEILDNNIRLTTLGHIERLPAFVQQPLRALCAESQKNEGMTLALALSYGGREEIATSVRAIAQRVAAGELRPEDIDESTIEAGLETVGWPEPDLLIRTSGEIRLSNFLLWQSAYAELFFTEVLWPDFDRPHLEGAIAAFNARQRRYGLTAEQVQSC